jgi:hypothetical protein
MKIKLTEPGYEHFTGLFGIYEFEDGVSVEDLGRGDCNAISSLVAAVDAETGLNPSMAQVQIDLYNRPAPIEVEGAPSAPPAPEVVVVPAYTKESLEAVADAQGIKGVRDIADPMGIKGVAISELIEKILAEQAE